MIDDYEEAMAELAVKNALIKEKEIIANILKNARKEKEEKVE